MVALLGLLKLLGLLGLLKLVGLLGLLKLLGLLGLLRSSWPSQSISPPQTSAGATCGIKVSWDLPLLWFY